MFTCIVLACADQQATDLVARRDQQATVLVARRVRMRNYTRQLMI
jgi:hypothetical protein